jgi:hypothetical protein
MRELPPIFNGNDAVHESFQIFGASVSAVKHEIASMM